MPRFGLFGLSFVFGVLSSLPSCSSCYCGIGFQSGYTPAGFSSGYASWSSPSAIGGALTASSTPSQSTFRNGQTSGATGGLTWNTAPGNPYGNAYAIDSASFLPQPWSALNLPATVMNPLSGSPFWYPTSYYLPGTLSGCVIPLGQTKFVTSIQFQPYAYLQAGNSWWSSYHADTINSYVQPAGSGTQTSVPVFSNGGGIGTDTFFTGEFALTLGTNYFYIAVGNTDVSSSQSYGGCPFVYKYTITCTQGAVKGDPQFTGFRGQDYQIHGQSGTVYNVLSTPSFQYNALFSYLSSGRCRSGTLCFSHPGNYFGAVGMLIRDQSEEVTSIKVVAGSVDEGMKVSINDITLTPSDHSLVVGNYTIEYPSVYELLIESNELNLKLSNSDFFINQDVSIGNGLLSQIAEHKQMARTNQTRANELESILPHGLLGQTWQSKQHNNRWKFIEGHLYDYIVDGLNGKEFKYNRFQ